VSKNHSERHGTRITPPDSTTGRLTSAIGRHPGPVLCIATTHDVFEATSRIRARRGPVHVFNPQGTGGAASTVRWNPLDGCQDPATATRRATAFAQSAQRGADGTSFWAGKASDYLRARPAQPLTVTPLGAAWLVHATMLTRQVQAIDIQDATDAPELFWACRGRPDPEYRLLEVHSEGISRRIWAIR
jgi:hypothetical protein